MHVCSTAFIPGDMFGPRRTLLIDGEYYTVNRFVFGALQSGISMEELELEPDNAESEECEWDYVG